MSVRVSCPFCNTAFDLPTVPPSRRTPCPRCGESVPIKQPTTGENAVKSPLPEMSRNGEPLEPYLPPPQPAPEVARALIPLFGLGLGLVVLVIGIWFFDLFGLNRPEPVPTVPAPPKAPTTWPPVAVPGLAYLPPQMNVVAAVQPRAVVAYAERTQTDAKQLLAKAGVPARVFATLDQLGLPPERVEAVVLGLAVSNENAIPRGFLVLTLTAPPTDEAAFLKGLKASRFVAPSGAARYKVDLGGLPVEMTTASATVYVFATDGKDLEQDWTATKTRGVGHLLTGLRDSFAKLSPASVVWLATDNADWATMQPIDLASKTLNRPEILTRLAGVRAGAIGVAFEPDPVVRASVRGDGKLTQPQLREKLRDLLGDRGTVDGEGEWATGEAPVVLKP